MTRKLILIFLTLMPLAAGHAKPINEAEAFALRHSPVVRDALATLPQQNAGVAPYVHALGKLADDTGMDPAKREAALFAATLGLARYVPDASARQQLARLKATPVVTTLHFDEGHGHGQTPAFDVAAAARHVEQRWAINAIASKAGQHIAARVPLDRHAINSGDAATDIAGIASALEVAALEDLRAQRAALLQWLEQDTQVGGLALIGRPTSC